MLRQGSGKEGEGVGSRVRDRRDQGPGAAGPVIRGLVNGGPQLRWQPGIAAGILGGHPVGEERRSADRLKLVGEEHEPGGGGHVSGVHWESAHAQGPPGDGANDAVGHGTAQHPGRCVAEVQQAQQVTGRWGDVIGRPGAQCRQERFPAARAAGC